MAAVRSKRNRKVKKHSRVHKLKRVYKSLTDYTRRYRLLRGEMPYLTITRSKRQFNVLGFSDVENLSNISFSMASKELRKHQYDESLVSRKGLYLLGFLFGKKMITRISDDQEFIINFGIYSAVPGGRFYSVVRGIYDSGFPIRCSTKNFPSDELLSNNDQKALVIINNIKEKIEHDKE